MGTVAQRDFVMAVHADHVPRNEWIIWGLLTTITAITITAEGGVIAKRGVRVKESGCAGAQFGVIAEAADQTGDA